MGDTFRVATWNILCQNVGRERRLRVITDRLTQLTPDVVMFQEVWVGAADSISTKLGMSVAVRSTGVNGVDSNVAILSRWDVLEQESGRFPFESSGLNLDTEEQSDSLTPGVGNVDNWAYALLQSPCGRLVAVYTSHLAWGGLEEPVRLKQAVYLELLARGVAERHPSAVHVLGGDLNATPESSTVRFMTGLQGSGDVGAFWVDAWAASGSGYGFTSDPSRLSYAVDTARSVGIHDVSQIPGRRIDFLMSRGWVYGRPGFPLQCEVFDGEGGSDHNGVFAEFAF